MANKNNRVKTTNDIELKDRLVAINRVTKVTKGGRTFTLLPLLLLATRTASWAGVLAKPMK